MIKKKVRQKRHTKNWDSINSLKMAALRTLNVFRWTLSEHPYTIHIRWKDRVQRSKINTNREGRKPFDRLAGRVSGANLDEEELERNEEEDDSSLPYKL